MFYCLFVTVAKNFSRGVLKQLENSYLSGSYSRILEPVQSMFGLENMVPSHDEIDALIRVLTR